MVLPGLLVRLVYILQSGEPPLRQHRLKGSLITKLRLRSSSGGSSLLDPRPLMRPRLSRGCTGQFAPSSTFAPGKHGWGGLGMRTRFSAGQYVLALALTVA